MLDIRPFIMLKHVTCPESELYKALCHIQTQAVIFINLSARGIDMHSTVTSCLLFYNETPSRAHMVSVCSMSSPTVCRTSNDFHLSCLILCVLKLVSEGPSNVTLPHIPPVSHCYDPSIIQCIITLYSYHSACHCNFHWLCPK